MQTVGAFVVLGWSARHAINGRRWITMPTASTNTTMPTMDSAAAVHILNLISLPVMVTKPDGVIVLANHAMEELLGQQVSSLIGMRAGTFSAPAHAEADASVAKTALQTGQAQSCNSQWITKDRRDLPVRIEFTPFAVGSGGSLLLQAQNLSEQHKLESDLRQSQKMESIGRLAGGIAHDFNNALTTILGLTESMISGRSAPNAESLREIRHAAQHAADLTSQMLAFSRRTILQMRSIRLEDVVENIARMIARLIGEDIQVDVSAQAQLPSVRGDQSQIEQVLLNLCLNARDAMPKGGQLRIELKAETLTPSWCSARPGARPGSFVALSVIDNGVGMDVETLARIFEPFFTRKAVGQGTGLGLSMVYGIVEQHEGFIDVISSPGQGATFTIYFPAEKSDAQATETPKLTAPASAAAITTTPKAAGPSRPATILVVEDEKSVRRLFLELLPKLGHRIYSAADGDEAIKVFERWAGQIDLVLLDAIIPKTGSGEVYDYIRRKKPGVRFLFTSGYNEVFINQKFELDPSFVFLRKPFNTQQLTEKIQAALEQDVQEVQDVQNVQNRG